MFPLSGIIFPLLIIFWILTKCHFSRETFPDIAAYPSSSHSLIRLGSPIILFYDTVYLTFIEFVVCPYLLNVCLSNWIVTSLEASTSTIFAHHCILSTEQGLAHGTQ